MNDDLPHTHPGPRPHGNSGHHDRAGARAPYAGTGELELLDINDRLWAERRDVTDKIVVVTEELLARLVASHLPDAAEVVLYEDLTHDAPHGHVLHVLDDHGRVLLPGTGDAWHDLGWTDEADELVFDLHHLDRSGFHPEPGDPRRRIRRIPVTVPEEPR